MVSDFHAIFLLMRMAATKMSRAKAQRRKEIFLFFVTVTQE
jgi:hypothetical protein